MLTGFTGFIRANNRTITGTVYEAGSRSALPGVNVLVTGTTINTITNASGNFTINLPDGKNELRFSFVGYKTQTVKVGKQNKLDVYLKDDNTALNEVVVVGYASQKKVTMTGAVSSLAGKVAGIQVRGMASVNPQAVVAYDIVSPPPYPNTNSESYGKLNENKFLNPKDNPLSTFSVDVDAASYSNVRRFINNGQLPPRDAVRIEEMINYFKYQLPGPENDEPVAITTEMAAAPWNPAHRLLRIGLKARTINNEKLPPSNLVFLIDVSGSMYAANKLPLVKESMKMLVEQLRAQDDVAIVVYAGQAGLVLPATPGDKKETIKDAIDRLSAGGSTAGGAGIKLAYKVAHDNFKKGGNNRIILATDGDFNVGASSDESMEELITKERESGIDLSVLGFGMGNYKDSKMETLADKGNGNYAYIDNATEARKALVSEFGGTMFTVAKDVKLQIEFNPAKVQAYRLIGYENRMLAKEDFNNDKKDAGDMGSGHTVTAFYEIIPTGIKDNYAGNVDPLKYQKVEKPVNTSGTNEMLTIKFRYKQPQGMVSKMSQVIVMDKPVAFNKLSDDYRFAAAVAEVGMLLRNSEFKAKASFEQAVKIAKAARGNDEDGYRAEFVRLAESARLLAKNNELAANDN